ncbi:MAG: hypothetical protein Alpg2KO_00700 [Alphaproteobacteria bacterium]
MCANDDTYLADLDDSSVLEFRCPSCRHFWKDKPSRVRLQVDHVNMSLTEVAENMLCRGHQCHRVGMNLRRLQQHQVSSWVGGMP